MFSLREDLRSRRVTTGARLRLSWVVISLVFLAPTMALTQPADFSHPDRPHLMGKNPFAGPDQTDQLAYLTPRIGSQPLLVILLEFPDAAHNSEHTVSYFQDLIFGPDPSVNGYYKENSYGKYSFTNAGVVGWYTASETAAHFFDPSQTDNQYTQLAAEAVRAAASDGFWFNTYDRDGDAQISPDELLVLMILADHPPLGKPNLMATRSNQAEPQGVLTPDGIEVDTWATRVEENLYKGGVVTDRKGFYISFYAHELAHLAVILPDLYNDNFGQDPAGNFSPMSIAGAVFTPHLSPWAKIHLGWIEPVVVSQSGWYTIKAVENSPEAYILYSPDHGINEYYIIENRWPPASIYESQGDNPSARDRGLAIWHITEFYDDEPFDFLTGRKMIGMKWAGGPQSLSVFPFIALWDCSDPASCYDFSDDSTPRNSRWQDGTPSRIKITDISVAGETMQAYFSLL